MMNGSKRNIFEKIILFILFILALPFTVSIFLLFIIVYLIIFPFEYPFYRYSKYYQNLNSKYYLTITLSYEFRTYNRFIKSGTLINVIINEITYPVYEYNNIKLIPYSGDSQLMLEENIIILIKQSDVEEEFYKTHRKNKKYLFY